MAKAISPPPSEVASQLGVSINDLYGVISGAGRDRLLLPDGVHLSGDGYRILGEAVASSIRGHVRGPSASQGDGGR